VAHTLLLADDSVTIQRVIELTFADEDVQVVAVSDGDQAIARLEKTPPDIVLADIGMPGKNGYEVARYVKQSPRLAHIPVVLLTGAFEPVDQARATEVGCDGVLAKPFEPQLVIGRVRELLSSDAHVATAAPSAPAPAAQKDAASTAHAELDDYFDRLDVAFAKLSATTPPLATSKPADAPAAEESAPAARRPLELVPPPATHDEEPSSIADEIDRYAVEHDLQQSEDIPLSFDSPNDVAEMLPTVEPETDAPAADTESAAHMATPVSDVIAEVEAFVAHTIPEHPVDHAAIEHTPVEHAAIEHHDMEHAIVEHPIVEHAHAPVTVDHAASFEPFAAAASVHHEAVASVPSAPLSVADAFAAILAAEGHATHAETAWPAFQAPSSSAPAISDDLVEQISRRVLAQMTDRVVRETVSTIVADVAERLIREEIERIKASLR
jgi:CheY-like chemotaxis protein